MMTTTDKRTITAVSTPHGTGGIAVIRLSGEDALEILGKAWRGKEPTKFSSHSVHLGWLVDDEGEEIDQVVATYFEGPNSYTGENVVELSCHGSQWIQQHIINRLIECGASLAQPGEFTKRAVEKGKLDLTQAEGIIDLISASSKASARLAMTQLKGTFSRNLEDLRKQLIDLGVLLELELDFSEEEVEFADRRRLIEISKEILYEVKRLTSSFKAGSAFKQGVPVTLAGVPNSGKSSLLNALLGEEKAIVSDIPGTTRDVIEDTLEIDGILFRFIDTAGLRESADTIEKMGIALAEKRIKDSSILLYLIDPTQDIDIQMATMHNLLDLAPDGKEENKIERGDYNNDLKVVLLTSKADVNQEVPITDAIHISSKTREGIDDLKNQLVRLATQDFNPQQELIVTNSRHYEALKNAVIPLERLIEGLEGGVTADFLAQDLREADSYLGEITGAITSEEILHTVFSRYCIGK